MSFRSTIYSTIANPTYIVVKETDEDIPSGDDGVLTIVAPVQGRYILTSSMYVTGDLALFEVSGVCGSQAFTIDTLGADFTAYRSWGATILDCNGVDDVVITLTCNSTGDWTFTAGSYIELIRVG
jgi:hypothetical protein